MAKYKVVMMVDAFNLFYAGHLNLQKLSRAICDRLIATC